MSQYNGVRAAILEAAKTEHGVSTAALPGYTIKQVGRSVQKLCEAGRLFAAHISRRNVHYFDTMQRAQEYEALYKGKCVEGVTIKRTSAWEAAAPMVIPDGVRRIIDEAPTERFAPDAEDDDWRLFSSLKPGQYIAPPSKWVEAVA